MFFKLRAKLCWKKKATKKHQAVLFSVNAWIGTGAMFAMIPLLFWVVQSFYVRDCNMSDVWDRKYNNREWWCCITRVKRCFSRANQWLIVLIGFQCVSNWSGEDHSVHRCLLGGQISALISAWCIKTTYSLVAEVICTKYSFIHARTEHTISEKNSFKFSTEVHNPLQLHAHRLAQSRILFTFILHQINPSSLH